MVDISNEHKCFQFAVSSVVYFNSLDFHLISSSFFSGPLAFRGFIPFDRLVKALFFSNSLV